MTGPDNGNIVPLQGRSGFDLIHGTGLLIGPRAVLLRGPAGSGKSLLAGALIQAARRDGMFARLVADDQIEISAANKKLVLSAPSRIAGLREHAGIGIFEEAFEKSALAGLVVDIEPGCAERPRLPDPGNLVTEIAGIEMARIHLASGGENVIPLVLSAMACLHANNYLPRTLASKGVESLLHPPPQQSKIETGP